MMQRAFSISRCIFEKKLKGGLFDVKFFSVAASFFGVTPVADAGSEILVRGYPFAFSVSVTGKCGCALSAFPSERSSLLEFFRRGDPWIVDPENSQKSGDFLVKSSPLCDRQICTPVHLHAHSLGGSDFPYLPSLGERQSRPG